MHSLQPITKPVAHAEGPHWVASEQALYYVDIAGFSVHRYDTKEKKHTSIKLNDPVGLVIPIKNVRGKFVIGYGTNITILEWDGISNNYKLHTKYQVDVDKPGNRFNDGKADFNGNLWLGTMGREEPAGVVAKDQGTLYRVLASNCKLDSVLVPVSVSNGITWNGDNTIMYYIDSPTRKIDAFDFYLKTATIENRRTLFDFEKNNVPGLPDGMTSDSHDNLWIACWGGSKVIQVSKEGKLLRSILLPVTRVSSATWGGPNLDILYVTTISAGLSAEELKVQPDAGAVFAITGLGVKGRKENTASSCLID
uniref:Regucalcin n=1 Tax=Panstrongylus lignarius TaxID=156445 RepID=A0A224XUC0_9HEMI